MYAQLPDVPNMPAKRQQAGFMSQFEWRMHEYYSTQKQVPRPLASREAFPEDVQGNIPRGNTPPGFTLIMLIIYNIKTVTVARHLLVSGRTSAKW